MPFAPTGPRYPSRPRALPLVAVAVLVLTGTIVTWRAAALGSSGTIEPGIATHAPALPGSAGSPGSGGSSTPRARTASGHRSAGATGAIPEGTVVTAFDVDNPAVAGLDPALLRSLQDAASAAAAEGVTVRVTSGWRSAAYQQKLLDQAVVRYGSLDGARQYVLPPTASAHVVGKAVDVGPTRAADWFSRHAGRFGLCQVYANELWHYERVADRSGNCPAMKASAAG